MGTTTHRETNFGRVALKIDVEFSRPEISLHSGFNTYSQSPITPDYGRKYLDYPSRK
jgi:hypothetical protein